MMKCEVGTPFCSGVAVRCYTGRKKSDPKFSCCIACLAILQRQGVKLKDGRWTAC